MKNIAKIIGGLRKEKGWSQTELARESGVNWEAAPSIKFAKRIADAFGVSLDFLSGEGVHSKLDKNH